MTALRCWLIGAAALALAGCQPKTAGVDTPADMAREADAIRGGEADRKEEISEKDLDKAASHFAPNAMIALPGAEPVRGTAEIRTTLAQTFKDPAFALTWTPDRIVVSKYADLAWASGRYSLTRTDPATRKASTAQGPFVETFTKAPDGRWLVSTGVLSQLSPPPADQ